MIQEIKELRNRIDGLANLVSELKPYKGVSNDYNSREIVKAYDSLILAKSWARKLMEDMSCPRDTENNCDCGCKDIKSIVDVMKPIQMSNNFKQLPHAEKVDLLIGEIQIILTIPIKGIINALKFDMYYSHLVEASMWLELEKERIKGNGI